MTTTEEQFILENSELNEEHLSVENDKKDSLTDEPEMGKNEAVKKEQCRNLTDDVDIPEKFRSKDGTVNIQSLVKSYKEIEPLINEKANLIKEKNDLIKQLSELKNPDFSVDFSKMLIDLYEKSLDKSFDIEKTKKILEDVKENITPESLEKLEKLFPLDVVKNNFLQASQMNVAENIKNKFELKKNEEKNVENYLSEVITKHNETLKNPIIANIFKEAFVQFGSDFDSDWFFGKMNELKESFILEYQKEVALNNEKESAITNVSKISPNNAKTSSVPLLKRNALDLSPSELDRMLDEYYSK